MQSMNPDGSKTVTYTLPPGAVRVTNMLSGLTLVGTMVNGIVLVAMVAEGRVDGGIGIWPAFAAVAAMLVVGFLVVRGSLRLARSVAGAATDLRAGWLLGMVAAAGAVPLGSASADPVLLWGLVWIVMVPVALVACVGGSLALVRVRRYANGWR